jgi:catechol 2,3-dioxygenase-like lactoylglutathione lyase family enzyme
MNIATDIREQLQLPPLDQIGFVVKDLDSAIALYDPMFGPFDVQKYGEITYNYRGREEACELDIAFGKIGDIEIELIQWVSGGGPHKEFLDAGREGMHHLRFLVENLEEKVSEAEKLGYQKIWGKRFGKGLAVAYMERENDPLIVEFLENHRGV